MTFDILPAVSLPFPRRTELHAINLYRMGLVTRQEDFGEASGFVGKKSNHQMKERKKEKMMNGGEPRLIRATPRKAPTREQEDALKLLIQAMKHLRETFVCVFFVFLSVCIHMHPLVHVTDK